MLLDAVVRRSDLMLESLEPLQPIVAYEASEATGGESCQRHRMADPGTRGSTA